MQQAADRNLALAKLRALVGDDGLAVERVTFFAIEGAPVSKARARFGGKGHHSYTPEKTVTAETVAAWAFKSALKGESFDRPIAIVSIFFRPDYQRIDIDNLTKLVFDAGTKAKAWVDDCYITAQASYVEFDRERPRTLVALCSTTSTLDRSAMFTCSICGQPFRRAGKATFAKPPQFCSRACRSQGYVNDRQSARCARCEVEFVRVHARQMYCSPECGESARRVRQPRENQRPWPVCQDCGKRVSRREYLRCAECSPKGRRLGSKNKVKL